MGNITNIYIKRDIEFRKIFFISKSIFKSDKILDIGCGNGEYFAILKEKADKVIGVDINTNLCKIAFKKGYISIIADARKLPFKDNTFDYIWASEIIEHLPRLDVINEIERVTTNKILMTLPNPIFPYYNKDPTHILEYSISSLRKSLRGHNNWNYYIRGFGYCLPKLSQIPKIFQILSLVITWFFPWFAPTIAIIGTKKVKKCR